jgi:acyl-coenzyme A synthetase/AMP-(fatty) acid ligase
MVRERGRETVRQATGALEHVAFVAEIPHTATGKIQKMALRQQFKDYVLPTAQAAE